jgi:3-phenylpropionate/cinnamic acid dioxygenase small subunit
MNLALEEKLAIHELLSRSAYGLDERDVELLASTFAEHARFSMRIGGGDLVGPFETRAGIMQLMTDSMAEQTDQRRHVVSNIFFHGENNGNPVVVSNLSLIATENGEIQLLSAGVYRDVVVKVGEGWEILDRYLELDKPY